MDDYDFDWELSRSAALEAAQILSDNVQSDSPVQAVIRALIDAVSIEIVE